MEHVVDQRLLVAERHVAIAEMGVCRSRIGMVLSRQDHSAAPAARRRYTNLVGRAPRRRLERMPELPEVETVRRGLAAGRWRARAS